MWLEVRGHSGRQIWWQQSVPFCTERCLASRFNPGRGLGYLSARAL